MPQQPEQEELHEDRRLEELLVDDPIELLVTEEPDGLEFSLEALGLLLGGEEGELGEELLDGRLLAEEGVEELGLLLQPYPKLT